jgi:hypothetical protein
LIPLLFIVTWVIIIIVHFSHPAVPPPPGQ